ncbi:MAG: YgiT-type zinc finger protein [Dehalococcoidia bacterium]|nr:YgiT-type zinc finger protein [Dehalococcoidia bacterium]
MTCGFCWDDETHPGTVTVTFSEGDATVIIKDVPAQICSNCEEYFLSEEVTEEVLERANGAFGRGTEVAILRYAA